MRVGLIIAATLLGACHVAAACRLSLSQASLDNFTDHPQRYLEQHSGSSQDLAYAIRNFASFNRLGLKSVAAMIRIASPLEKKAIGQGMAAAVNACLPRDGEVARQIADVVRTSADPDVIDAYMAAADDGASPSGSATAKAAPELDERPHGSISLGLDQSTTIANPDVPTIALPPPKN